MSDNQTSKALLGAYLVVGEDALKRETVLKRLHQRLSEAGDLAFNFDRFEGDLASGADIVAACNTIPFASDVRLVQVSKAEKLGKADSEQVVDYLGAPCASTVLALEAEKLAKNTRLYKAVAALGKTAVIDCAPPKAKDLPHQVRAMATSHGVVFTEGAARALVDLVGQNTVHLDAEIAKIALSHRGLDPVTEHEVMSLVSRTAEVKPWEFVDAFAERNLSKCMLCLARMDSVSPYSLIAQCTTRLREIICAKSLIERGNTAALAGILKKKDWQVKNRFVWARQFSDRELQRALSAARDTERAMKSGSDPKAAFVAWVVEVCAGTGARKV